MISGASAENSAPDDPGYRFAGKTVVLYSIVLSGPLTEGGGVSRNLLTRLIHTKFLKNVRLRSEIGLRRSSFEDSHRLFQKSAEFALTTPVKYCIN